MNFSAGQGGRKRPFGALGCGRAAMVTAAVTLGLLCAQFAPAQARRHAAFWWGGLFERPAKPHRAVRAVKVPLPKPRPAEAPGATAAAQARGEPEIPPVVQAAPQPTACRRALTEDIAVAPSIADIHGPGGCGGEDLVRLEAIVLPDRRRVTVTPAATLRCPMATAIADWVRTDIAPLAKELGSRLAGLDDLDSYDCRTFNGVKGAPLSDHGRANALDVSAFRLADGRQIELTDRNEPRGLREDMLHSACTRFMTVLGPDSDWHHENHIHLDLMERHNNYRICEWDVLDPLPNVAPMMPAERPATAPPRKVAGKEDAKSDAK